MPDADAGGGRHGGGASPPKPVFETTTTKKKNLKSDLKNCTTYVKEIKSGTHSSSEVSTLNLSRYVEEVAIALPDNVRADTYGMSKIFPSPPRDPPHSGSLSRRRHRRQQPRQRPSARAAFLVFLFATITTTWLLGPSAPTTAKHESVVVVAHTPAEPSFYSAVERRRRRASLVSSSPSSPWYFYEENTDDEDGDADVVEGGGGSVAMAPKILSDRPRRKPAQRSDDVDSGSCEGGTSGNSDGAECPEAVVPSFEDDPLRFVDYGPRGHPYDDDDGYEEEEEGDYDDDNAEEEEERGGQPRDLRRLKKVDDQYEPLRIHFDTTDLDMWASNSPLDSDRVDYLKTKVLPGMTARWSAALGVIPVHGNLRIDPDRCPFADPSKSPSLGNRGVSGADLVIYVTANADVCSKGWKVLASAASCFWDQYNRPVAGNIDFCLDEIEEGTHIRPAAAMAVDSAASDAALESAIGVAVHETAHVLGVTSYDMVYYYDSTTGKPRTPNPKKRKVTCVTGEKKRVFVPDASTLQRGVTDRGTRYFEVTTPTVRQAVRNHFDCQRLTGARLENQPTNEMDCFGSHFDERYFFTEALSAVKGGAREVLSSLTLGLLEDSGWYRPDYRVAKISPFGHGAGCDFVEKECIVDGEIPSYSEGYFCNVEYQFNNSQFEGELGCDATHTSMGICDLVNYDTLRRSFKSPDKEFQWFNNPALGGLMDRVDYCPTYSIGTLSCQELSGEAAQNQLNAFGLSTPIAESNSESSRCFNTDGLRPICLEAECDEKNNVVSVKLGGETITCAFDGQQHLIPGSGITFECPRLASICPDLFCPFNCAGHGICDLESKIPGCRCFDPTDKTPGCYESFKSINDSPTEAKSSEEDGAAAPAPNKKVKTDEEKKNRKKRRKQRRKRKKNGNTKDVGSDAPEISLAKTFTAIGP